MKSKAIGIRVETEKLKLIRQRAIKKGWSFNRWVNWATNLGLRSHKKKEV